jgi:hypothetical protein
MKGYNKLHAGKRPSITLPAGYLKGIEGAITLLNTLPPHEVVTGGRRPVRRITSRDDCIDLLRRYSQRLAQANLQAASEVSR